MTSITEDIEQWLLMDEKVVRKWRSLASRLGLSAYILDIDCYRGNKGESSSDYMRRKRNRRFRDKDKMDLLLQTWKSIKPECYTISTLKGILSSEGLTDMWMWINIITNKNDGSISPSSRTSPTKFSGTGGYGRFLYNNNNMYEGSSYSQSSYAESDCDYSWPQSPCSTRPIPR